RFLEVDRFRAIDQALDDAFGDDLDHACARRGAQRVLRVLRARTLALAAPAARAADLDRQCRLFEESFFHRTPTAMRSTSMPPETISAPVVTSPESSGTG